MKGCHTPKGNARGEEERGLSLKSQTSVTVQMGVVCSLKSGWAFKLKEKMLRTENFRAKVWGSLRLGLSFLKDPPRSLQSTRQPARSNVLYSVGLSSTVPPCGSKTQQQERNTGPPLCLHLTVKA